MKLSEGRSSRILQLFCVVLATMVLGSGPARGATLVDACGTVITEPGHYVVAFDLNCSDENGITIDSTEGVNLDLGGHTITGNGQEFTAAVVTVFSSGIQITNGTVRGFESGIALIVTHDSSVKGITARENTWGTGVFGSSGIAIQDNSLVSNAGAGLVLTGDLFGLGIHSQGNKVQDNEIRQNSGNGVLAGGTSQNTFRDNTMTLNGSDGLAMHDSDDNRFQGNVMSENGVNGVLLVDCARNTIRGNTVNENSWSGIALVADDADALGNLIQGNTALGNNLEGIAEGVADLVDFPECVNTWKGNTFETDWEGSMAGYGPGEGCIQ